MTTRRTLLAAGLGAIAAPLATFAQQKTAKVPRIGYLDASSSEYARYRADHLRAGLRDLGYAEGKSIVIDYRYAEGNFQRLSELAAQLVQLRVDVIVAATTQGIQAAARATNTIPIVMCATSDPVGSGFVASLSRPGGNVTGLSNIAVDLSSKYLELLRIAIPKLSRVAVLTDPTNPNHPPMRDNVQASAKSIGVNVNSIQVGTVKEMDAAFATMKQERAGALILLPDVLFFTHARRIAELAAQQRLPTLFWTQELVESGGLMSYGQKVGEHYYRAATYVDKILKGAKPSDLPVEQPTKIELVINLRTAKVLGLTIPQELILRADRVIE